MGLKRFMEELRNARVATATSATPATLEQPEKNDFNKSATATVATTATLGANKDGTLATDPEQCTPWQAGIEEWQPATPDMHALKKVALGFLASEWAEKAAALGWGEVDLFGLFPKLEFARFRYGSWGLVTHLGLSIHKPQIVLISDDCATVRTVGGATQVRPRVLPEAKISRPFWECRA
jgi:hypothetical protein